MIELAIDDSCIKCGRCVSVCPAHILVQEAKQSEIKTQNLQTCIECGQCVAICPTDSVLHSTFPEGTIHDVDRSLLPTPAMMMELLRKRRSNRTFTDKPVPENFLGQILEAAHLAPSSSNGQPLKYTLVTNPEILNKVTEKTIEIARKLSEQLLKVGNTNRANYLKRLCDAYDGGTDLILRGAKALMLIHSEIERSDDPNIAYQNASLMAESLNVGHFYTGYICNFVRMNDDRLIEDLLDIEGTIHAGMALGMPQYKFKKYMDRKPMILNRFD